MPAWRLYALLILAALPACSPDVAPGTGLPGSRVLVMAPARVPVVSEAIAAVERRNQLRPESEKIEVDFRQTKSVADVARLLQSLMPEIRRYRVVFTPSQTMARVAQRMVPADLPIVFDGVDDPVGNCLVDSLRRPGRNATGYMHQLPDTELKMLELMRQGFPKVRRVLVLASGFNFGSTGCDPLDPGAAHEPEVACTAGLHDVDADARRVIDADRIEAFGKRLGLAVRFFVVCGPNDFGRLADALADGDDLGVVVPWHSLFDEHAEALVRTLGRQGLPAIYPNRHFLAAGGPVSLEPIVDRGKDRATVQALMQVIAGQPTASLPVQGPRGYEVVFNAAGAARQKLEPSLFLLRRADRVLQ